MQEKIREYSSSSQVEVLTENNRTVLALYEPENTGYVTYIYLYKRKLRELFTKKERGIEWESGQELVSADTFSVIKQKEDLLRIHLSGSGQKARNLYQAQQEASSMAEILEGGTDSLYHRYVYPFTARRLRPLRWEMNCVCYLLDPFTARRLRPLRWEMNCVCYLLDRAS